MDLPNKDLFKEQYSRLNKAQKQAVDTIDGPVMVIAGPGTGKTSILTLRIANILKQTDTSPENILALTFTESGAYAMRKKLVSIVGTDGYKVNISTFHGFCNEVIKQYPERFPRIIGSKAITEIDQIALMEKIIEKNDFSMLKPYGDIFFYVKPSLSEIRNLKREAIGIFEFENIIIKQEKEFEDIPEKVHIKGAHKGKMKGEYIKIKERIEKNKELLVLYREYEKALEKNKFYDFEDMIVEVIKTLKKDEDLLLILQENYQYILADEHQDANNAQNAILELLSNFHDNPNLFIVGDEKQAIYRFQGASLDNFLYFKKKYKNAVVIDLEENYRSTQTILDASHSLISKNIMPEGYVRVSLQSRAEKGKELLKIFECIDSDSENNFIIENIKEKIKKGVEPSEIAVLYRDNKDVISIADAFSKNDIPYRVESDSDILKDENVCKLITIFELINDLSNEEKLGKFLFIDFFNINSIEIFKIFDQTRKEKRKLIDLVKENFPELADKISTWASLSMNKPFVDVFEIVIRESGFLQYALSSDDSLEKMSVLEMFFNEIKKLSNTKGQYYLSNFIEHIERVREHGILTKTGKALEKDGVRLMTAHKSKGLEFEYVYIVGVYDGHWGNKIKRTFFTTIKSFEANMDDERRLFYVALTRARKEVVITYPRENSEGKELLPSQFLDEISSEHKEISIVENKIDIKEKFREKTVIKNQEIGDKQYLQNLFLEQGLAVTALNNYIKCPWEYFFVNLIRLPKAQSKHQMYGIAIHETLRVFFNKYKEEQDMSLQDLLSLFEFNLKNTLLSPSDLSDSLNKGRDSLQGYFEAYKGTWNRNLLTEYSIRGVHVEVQDKRGDFTLILKGNLDKIEFIDDTVVNVVDYKTGKRKSDNKENYHRQLSFYKLLLQLDEKKTYIMKSGELDFVEPGSNGKYVKDRFEISDEEVEKLLVLIKEKASEIYNLDFFDKNCEDKDCEYCLLGRSMKK
jgi:DNA helicase-2/ATP-dependent DNA helicase PcrA